MDQQPTKSYKNILEKLDQLQLNLELLKQFIILISKYEEVSDDSERVANFINRFAE
jgi:hypothetical protein